MSSQTLMPIGPPFTSTTAPGRQVWVAAGRDVMPKVPPLPPVAAEPEALHGALERQPVAEDAARCVEGVGAGPELVEAAQAEALAVAKPHEREIDCAAGVVPAAGGDVGPDEVGAAAPARPAHQGARCAERAVGVEDEEADPVAA